MTTAVALKIWKTVADPSFLAGVRDKAGLLDDLLVRLAEEVPYVERLVGAGLVRGVVLKLPAGEEKATMGELIGEAARRGLLLLRSGSNRLRIAPPLTITDTEIRRGVGILKEVLRTKEGV